MNDPTAWPASLDGERYISLETFRRNGTAVRTPIWFAAAPRDEAGMPRYYVYSTADSGKAKRLRRSAVARIAACDMRGTVKGAWFDARAEIIDGAEFNAGMALLDRKYFPWKQLIGLAARFRPRPRVVIRITPAATAP